jgi:hypothetical protein
VPTEVAARLVGVKPETMKAWRRVGRGPIYTKLYSRCVYKIGDIEAFLAARVVDPAGRRQRQEEVCV